MPFGHITPVCMVVCRGMVSESDSIRNDSIELLEIMFDGRAFHSLAVQLSVVGKKIFPNVFKLYTCMCIMLFLTSEIIFMCSTYVTMWIMLILIHHLN